MKKFVLILYWPGSAGNFLSRCINLLDNAYTFVSRNDLMTLPSTIEEKLSLLSYSDSLTLLSQQQWPRFEQLIVTYCFRRPHWDLPNNAIACFIAHPTDFDNFFSLIGKDDKQFVFYIDPHKCYEWAILNSLHKNSYYNYYNYESIEKYLQGLNVHKIDLNEIITSSNNFFTEFKKICDILEHVINADEEKAIKQLYKEWYTTTLKPEQFEEFKKQCNTRLLSNRIAKSKYNLYNEQ